MNQVLAPESVYQELDLGSARGGTKPRMPLDIQVIRSLNEADLPAIAAPPPVANATPVIRSIRHSHHRLAQLLAEGKTGAEIALVTGYSQSYLSTIQNDPAFEELVNYYAEQSKAIFVDAQERLKALSLDATEQLHERLHDPNEVWSKKDLMDVIKMGLPAETGGAAKPLPGRGTPPGDGSGFTLNVKFVAAPPPGSTPAIDGDFHTISPENPE